MKLLVIVALLIRVSGSPSPAGGVAEGLPEAQTTDCVTTSASQWAGWNNSVEPYGVTAAETQVGDGCRAASAQDEAPALP